MSAAETSGEPASVAGASEERETAGGDSEAADQAAPATDVEAKEEGSDDDDGGDPFEGVDVSSLSKTARKKLLKRHQKNLHRKKVKQQKKEEKHAQTEAKRVEAQARFEAMTEEEKAAAVEAKQAIIAERKAAAAAKREKQRAAMENGQGLVVDLEFGDLMSEAELKSLCSQLMYCYSSNNNASKPAKLTFTGLSGVMGDAYKGIPGSGNWFVRAEEQPYIDVFAHNKESLVYLTADSPNEVAHLEEGKVYIVGGIVDHNRYKNLTLDKANKQGIAHGHLPIGSDLKMMQSRVLTVNQVVDIMINFMSCGDWHDALVKAIPSRKRQRDGDDEEEGDDA